MSLADSQGDNWATTLCWHAAVVPCPFRREDLCLMGPTLFPRSYDDLSRAAAGIHMRRGCACPSVVAAAHASSAYHDTFQLHWGKGRGG
jgi:hypothetical protein